MKASMGKGLLTILAISLGHVAFAGSSELSFSLRSFSFTGPGRRPLEQDCDRPPCPSFPAPDFVAAEAGEEEPFRASPVAYLSGSQLQVTALELTVSPSSFHGLAWIRADGPDGLDLGGPLLLHEGRAESLLGDLYSPIPFPSAIEAYEPLELTWTVTVNGQAPISLGVTSNPVYLLLDEPLGHSLESFVAIGARAGAGATTLEEAIEQIWMGFEDLSVENAKGEVLGYYRGTRCPSDVEVYDAPGLVTLLNGQCGAWQDLLIAVLRAQGVDSALPVVVQPQTPGDVGFLVHSYAFDVEGGGSGCVQYPYIAADPCDPSPWDDEVRDRFGEPGQSVADPASFFGLHYLVKINGAYYDPSYGIGPISGTREQAALAWERLSIAGLLGVCGDGYAARPDNPDWLEVSFSL